MRDHFPEGQDGRFSRVNGLAAMITLWNSIYRD